MRRLQKAMIGVFCGGVFLAGLGTGIAVYEVSSFTYMGEKEAGRGPGADRAAGVSG